jgi:hypothetical protein
VGSLSEDQGIVSERPSTPAPEIST